ncbi:adenylyltransferase/sulfurtransferase MoeZ [Rhodococcus spongiicola]|uniref:Probable adenylyltransferase/sulfurtransferase MoeZ n=1 Tax=Rhodococcus spongiicola TaxID=2487352 RepID=A0A3S3B7J6_9NOCA|nr:adenylyltransferase/sulfurtransferase MoeZ [Rhodococcus spongiicola]RVW04987.1 adenylyltransferase/sulfurtransferase MoeZ [Rhodococcus spongiicola]
MPARSSLPPLVEPAAELSREEVARYSRHLIIPDIGTTGQKRLKNARVLVIGAGGLGSPTLMYLAAAGVGTIGIVDFDVVDESNLQRQVIHGTADVGRSKALSARESIREINPHVDVRLHDFRLDASNAVEVFEQYDLILDGADNFATRYLVNDAAVLAHRPYVWGSIYRFQGQVSVFWDDPPEGYGVTGTTLRDLYPEAPPPGTVPSCAEGGVLGVLCASVGSIMATEAIKLITGVGESLLGRLMIHDALAMSYRTVTLSRDPDRVPVTELVDYDAFCGVEPVADTGQGWAITPLELRDLIDSGADIAIVDVREPVEWDIVHLPGATLIPKDRILSGEALADLPQDKRLVLHCKTGIRSAEALVAVRRAGFADAVHLQGGVVAWAHQVDPSLPVY